MIARRGILASIGALFAGVSLGASSSRQRWEYRIEDVWLDDGPDLPEIRGVLARLGNEGWELIDSQGVNHRTLIFKRPKG